MSDEIVAVFSDPDAGDDALRALRAAGVTGARIASPAAYPAVHATGRPGPWRLLGWIALGAAILGLASAIALEVATSQSMNEIAGGKPVISWPAFGVVMFELTLLFAGAANFCALVFLSALARRRVPRRVRQAMAADALVVVVPVAGLSEDRLAKVQTSLAGAAELGS